MIAFIVTVICSLIGYFGRTLSVRFGCNEYVGIAIGGFAAMVSAYGFYSHIEQDSLVYVLFVVPYYDTWCTAYKLRYRYHQQPYFIGNYKSY